MWIRVVLVLAIAAFAVLMFWRDDSVQWGGAVHEEPAASANAPADAPAATPTLARDAAAPAADEAFVSEGEDAVVVANPVRDGLAILVFDARREPLANAKLDVRWRKGFGLYGNDRGRADARGRFATTIAEYEMIEGVTLHGADGDLEHWSDFLPMANDPHTVLVIAAKLEPVTVRVVDQSGVPVAHARVLVEGGKDDAVPREHVLVPAIEGAETDAAGVVGMRLPPREHTFQAQVEGYVSIYSLRAGPPFAGRTLTMHLLDRRALHDVAVTVVAPDELQGALVVGGWTRELPAALPGLEPSGVEPLQAEFASRRLSPREFVVKAPPVRWHCTASANGNWGAVDVDAFDTRATVELKLPPASPMARLRCKLLLPDGQQTSGEIMVHKTPDLVNGSRELVSAKDPFVAVEPGGKACVSAWVHEYAPVVVGPIELTAGEHEVTFQFVPPLSIRGQVVDEQGKPVRATVNLLRPAGALRSLAAGVPAVVASSGSGDSLGTGEDGEGRFWFEDVGVGEHELYAVPEGVGWPARVRVTPGDQNVVVRLGTGIDDLVRVTGRVTMSGTGQPVAGAQVRWLNGEAGGRSYTDADGRYAQVVKPGRLHVEVMARRCAVHRGDDKDFAIGLATEPIVLSPSEPLFVRVRDADGKVPEVEVAGRDEQGRELVFLDANGSYDGECLDVGSSGRVALRGLPVGKFTLILRENGDGDAKKRSQEVEVPANTPRDAEFVIVWAPVRKGP